MTRPHSQLPRMSVVMAVFNRERMVMRAIESILAQDFEDFEFVIVDDGSRDRTAEVIASVADPRIRFVSLPANGGIAIARNTGLAMARGEFIVTMDSDDVARPNRLREQYAYLRRHDDVDIVGSWVTKVQGGRRTPLQHNPQDAIIKARLLALDGTAMFDPTTTMRAAFLRRTGLQYRWTRTDVDHLLWTDAMVLGARFAIVEHDLLDYHRHEGNVTAESGADYLAHERRKTPMRARLLGLFFPALTYAEAQAIADWMEIGRRSSIPDVCAAITAIRKAMLDTTSYWGESKAEVGVILRKHFESAMRALSADQAARPPAPRAPPQPCDPISIGTTVAD